MGQVKARCVVPAALAVLLLAGCSSAPDGGAAGQGRPAEQPSGGAGAKAGAKVGAKAADRKAALVGSAGTPCALPVSFRTAADWTAEKVTAGDEDDAFASLARQGSVKLVCEIDAKPAGNIGFLRVWTGAGGGTPREVLESFMADEKNAGTVRYRETKAGELPATEVTYLVTSEFQDEPKKERALAVVAPGGAVVLHLGGLDTAEHEQMLPAYDLARSTMAVTG
ncbi:lipoprotein [Streptomyces sp. NPDC054887]